MIDLEPMANVWRATRRRSRQEWHNLWHRLQRACKRLEGQKMHASSLAEPSIRCGMSSPSLLKQGKPLSCETQAVKRSNTHGSRQILCQRLAGETDGRGGGPRAKVVLGAHVAASPQVRRYITPHGQRKDDRGGGIANGLISVIRGITSFYAHYAADTKLAAYGANVTL